MLRDLQIEGYRCFKKYRMENLRRVNLLVGENGCGKTAILEAISMLMAQTSIPSEMMHSAKERGETRPLTKALHDN